jgi:WhiB family transcriptional regulator, redox-sensing transcriptional regulator
MHLPGTTAWEHQAGFEAESALAAATTVMGHGPVAGPATIMGRAPLPAPATMAGVPSGRMLPCTDDPELFFAEAPEDVEAAKELCRACPARIACFAGAIERREPWGVWGGELFLRGEVVPRKRPRGRPRKAEEAA